MWRSVAALRMICRLPRLDSGTNTTMSPSDFGLTREPEPIRVQAHLAPGLGALRHPLLLVGAHLVRRGRETSEILPDRPSSMSTRHLPQVAASAQMLAISTPSRAAARRIVVPVSTLPRAPDGWNTSECDSVRARLIHGGFPG